MSFEFFSINEKRKNEQEKPFEVHMERVSGFRPLNNIAQILRDKGLSDSDIVQLKQDALLMMSNLQQKFSAHGIERKWKISDMIIDVDIAEKRIRSMIPTDWERTKISK